jgi:NaMN:DMB phosphoribosyltransferase
LQAFARGYVKEGVGAGGASIAAMLKSGGQINGDILLREVEQEYHDLASK